MKTSSKRLATAAAAVFLTLPSSVFAQDAEGDADSSAPADKAASAVAPAAASTPHQKLCNMLGLRVGNRYEFQLGGNDVHYWEVRSLGADGWILAKDSIRAATWVNLSQVISVTLIPKGAPERPEKRGDR